MSSILIRTSLRYLLRYPWQFGLCVLGVALGVAVVVAIDLANASARRAFALSTETVTGRATHQIVGGPTGLDESLYRRLRLEAGIRPAAPLVDGYVNAPDLGGQTMQLLGVDALAEGPFRSYLAGPGAEVGRAGGNVDLATLIVQPNAVVMSSETATRFSIQPGGSLRLRIGSEERMVQVVGLLQPTDNLSSRALESLLISDVATAQELLGMVGKLSRIDLILPPDANESAIAALLPPGVELTRPATRSNALEQMTRAFELNLSALSLLALVVGMFLIYNMMTFSVVQRRGLIGTLRCVGVSQRQIFALVLAEAAVISLLGSAFGLLLGVLLGQGLVQLVTQTINDLYFVVTVRSLELAPAVLLKGLLLGIGATLAAAAVPAWEATRTPPRTVLRRSSMEERIRRAVPMLAVAGLVLLALGGGLLALPSDFRFWILDFRLQDGSVWGLYIAFAALFFVVIGCALLTPAATVGAMALLRPLLGRAFGLLGRMAARDVVASLSRTAVAIAALMVAVSVTIGVGIMVGSFRGTVVSWLEQTLVADIYVSPPSNVANRTDTTVDPALVERFVTAPGVAGYSIFRSVQVDTPAGPTSIVAVRSTSDRGQAAVRFTEGDGDQTWSAIANGAVLISEPLAFRTGLGQGDTLSLRTDQGQHDFPIAGVYYDYTSDRGVIRMEEAVYRRFWNDQAISSFALYAAPGVAVDELVQQLRGLAPGANLVVGSNRSLREGTLAIFDRTFAITAVLQLLATIVAFIGILSALMALQLERARELGMLRANGLTPRQLWGVVLSQTGMIGLTAGVLAMPVGVVLALVLVYVINRRSFGWTLELNLDPALFGQALLVALVAALLAGIYPAFKMSRTSPAMALREE
ncbi:MAG: ABC transporter permease [Chloroflexaceae bacterium]|jgi:putative ABC transport system permease protein|nr:ABC transporter permease [Chloroflexaceae bacterium]